MTFGPTRAEVWEGQLLGQQRSQGIRKDTNGQDSESFSQSVRHAVKSVASVSQSVVSRSLGQVTTQSSQSRVRRSIKHSLRHLRRQTLDQSGCQGNEITGHSGSRAPSIQHSVQRKRSRNPSCSKWRLGLSPLTTTNTSYSVSSVEISATAWRGCENCRF